MRTYVTGEFRWKIENLLPLIKTQAHWEMLRIAFFSHAIDEETGGVLFGAVKIAEAHGVNYTNHFNAGRALNSFLDCLPQGVAEIVTTDGKEWSTGEYQLLGVEESETSNGQAQYQLKFKKTGDGKQRRVKFSWPVEIKKLLEKELQDVTTKLSDKVHFINGFKRNEQKERVLLRAKIEAALNEVEILSSEKGKDIAQYMNSLPVNSFTKLIENAPAALKIINTLPEVARRQQLNILGAIQEQPKAVYRPSENGNTDRLYGDGANITNLKKEVRKALTPDWFEADFQSLHLAIVAKVWNIPLLADFLKSGKSWWKELYAFLGVLPSSKAELKKFTYALVYGMSSRNIIDGLNKSLGNGTGNRFIAHPLVKAILNARLRVVKAANACGFIVDAYGAQHEVAKGNMLTLLSRQAQSYEQLLISSIYDLARTTQDFTITLLQHDGISINFSSEERRGYWMNRISETAKEACEALDIPSKLVWESNEVVEDHDLGSESTPNLFSSVQFTGGLQNLRFNHFGVTKKFFQDKGKMVVAASLNPHLVMMEFSSYFTTKSWLSLGLEVNYND